MTVVMTAGERWLELGEDNAKGTMPLTVDEGTEEFGKDKHEEDEE